MSAAGCAAGAAAGCPGLSCSLLLAELLPGAGDLQFTVLQGKTRGLTTEIGQCLSASVWAFLSHWFLFLLLCLSRNRYKCYDFREVEMA